MVMFDYDLGAFIDHECGIKYDGPEVMGIKAKAKRGSHIVECDLMTSSDLINWEVKNTFNIDISRTLCDNDGYSFDPAYMTFNSGVHPYVPDKLIVNAFIRCGDTIILSLTVFGSGAGYGFCIYDIKTNEVYYTDCLGFLQHEVANNMLIHIGEYVGVPVSTYCSSHFDEDMQIYIYDDYYYFNTTAESYSYPNGLYATKDNKNWELIDISNTEENNFSDTKSLQYINNKYYIISVAVTEDEEQISLYVSDDMKSWDIVPHDPTEMETKCQTSDTTANYYYMRELYVNGDNAIIAAYTLMSIDGHDVTAFNLVVTTDGGNTWEEHQTYINNCIPDKVYVDSNGDVCIETDRSDILANNVSSFIKMDKQHGIYKISFTDNSCEFISVDNKLKQININDLPRLMQPDATCGVAMHMNENGDIFKWPLADLSGQYHGPKNYILAKEHDSDEAKIIGVKNMPDAIDMQAFNNVKVIN